MTKNLLKEYVKTREAELKVVSNILSSNSKLKKRDRKRENNDVDYARILYCSSFRRLQGKMQLLVPGSIQFYRNRLTHSLEVSQIARSIAKRIGMIDTLTVQSCALAHDIGNPPFGHAGEILLSKLDKKFPYEGNAQSFRILNHIEKKFSDRKGLDLTIRTILGIVKYPNNHEQNSKKFLYDEDNNLVQKWKADYKINLKTLDCEVMDLSDEIAYAAHDLEDSLRMKFFTIDDLLFEFKNSPFKACYDTLEKIIKEAKEFASEAHTLKSSEEYSFLLLRELTSKIVDLLVTDIGLVEPDSKLGYKKHGDIALGLKKLTFAAIKRRPDIIRYELLGNKVLTGLYDVFSDEKFNIDLSLLPAEYRDIDNKQRTILDYIGGMMDSYAINTYKIYFGESELNKLYKNDYDT